MTKRNRGKEYDEEGRKEEIELPIFDLTEEGRKEEIELPIFDLTVIANATNNFSRNNKLGEGGFGPVYKVRRT